MNFAYNKRNKSGTHSKEAKSRPNLHEKDGQKHAHLGLSQFTSLHFSSDQFSLV